MKKNSEPNIEKQMKPYICFMYRSKNIWNGEQSGLCKKRKRTCGQQYKNDSRRKLTQLKWDSEKFGY